MAHRALARWQPQLEDIGIELAWTPVDLCALLGWPREFEMPDDRRANAQRIADELEVAVTVPRLWHDSRLAGAIAIALERSGREASWRERVFTAHFEQGLRLEDRESCARAARELELDLDALDLEAAQRELSRRTEEAVARQVTGVPTYMLAGWPLGGIQPEKTTLSMLGRWARRQREG